MIKHLNDIWMNAQFERNLGHSCTGGADIGECFSLLAQLEQGGFEDWYSAWYGLGTKLQQQAESYVISGQRYSAHATYLRASNYFRSSFFFLDENPRDPRIEQAYDRSVDTFQKALIQSHFVYKMFEIPFLDKTLPATLFFPNGQHVQWPLIIDTGGGDATKEECFFNMVPAALNRGYACLIFDGPGQGEMLRKQAIPFRPDWERVISAVIDEVLKSESINARKIILYGSSFGGYLAPRAATAEHRLAACIANPGVLNAGGAQTSNFPKRIQDAMVSGDDELVDSFFKELSNSDKMKGFLFESRKIRFGADTISEMFRLVADYTMEQSVDTIQCPTLILDNELEHITAGEAIKLYERLRCTDKHYHLFKASQGHGGHCQPLSHQHSNEVIFSWLASLGLNGVPL